MDKKEIATSAIEHSIRVQEWALGVIKTGVWEDPPIIGGEPGESTPEPEPEPETFEIKMKGNQYTHSQRDTTKESRNGHVVKGSVHTVYMVRGDWLRLMNGWLKNSKWVERI